MYFNFIGMIRRSPKRYHSSIRFFNQYITKKNLENVCLKNQAQI